MMNKTDYCKNKADIIRAALDGKDVSAELRVLTLRAPKFCKNDADIEWLRICAKTEDFTRAMPIKKAEKLVSAAMNMEPIGTSSFSDRCAQKAIAYFEACRSKTQKAKRMRIGAAVVCSLLVVCAAVGAFAGDKTGLFYGAEGLTYYVDGQEYRQENVVKYNNYVQLSVPKKKGYDVTGIIDAKTNTQLFDASGKSLAVVSNRDLSDYDNYVLEVTYEPHVYSAQVMTAKNVSLASVTYTVEDDPEDIFDDPQVLEGYVFDGWYTDAKYKKPFTGDFMDYADSDTPLVLYPHYALDGWTLTWVLNGGAFRADVLDAYTILSDVRLPNNDVVVREGYELKGWAMDGRIIDYFTPTVMKDTVLSAVWEPIRYNITYELNGGILAGAVSTFTVEDEFLLESPIRKGYTFEGWYANKIFTKSAVAIEQGTIGDKTVYAKWAPIVYTVSYELNGGENSPLNPTTYTAEKNIQLQNPVRKGYAFKGWYLDNEQVTELNASEHESAVLVAVWEKKEYTITVNPNNGSKTYKQTVKYEDFYSIDQPVKKGYTFTDYYMSGEPIDSVGQYTFTSDISVIARYKANQYTISYVSDSATVFTQQVTFDEPYRLYNPKTKLNHEFAGWHDKEVGGKRVSDGVYRNDGNTVLYASWIKVLTISLESGNEYTIDNTIEKAYVIGNYTGSNDIMTDINIKISARDYDLTLVLINAGFKASDNHVAINCENSAFTLKIINSGTSHIEGGNGSNGADGASGSKMNSDNRNGSNGLDGQYAINCGKVIFEETADRPSTLTLKSGNGGKGGNGGVDKDRSRMWLNYTPDGGNGGNVKAALRCMAYSVNGTTVELEKGTAGAKGKAGSRGDWWCAACYGDDGKAGTVYAKDVEYK